MKKMRFLAALIAISVASRVQAVPIIFTLAPPTALVNAGTLTVSGGGAVGAGTTNLSGTVVADVGLSMSGTPQSLQLLTSSNLSFSDFIVATPNAVPIGSGVGVKGTVSSGVIPITASMANLAGAQLIGNAGTLTVGPTVRNLAANNLTFVFNNASLLTLTTMTSGNTVNFSLSGPLNASVTEGTGAAAVNYVANAPLFFATGSVTLPEPAAMSALAVVGVFLRRRRAL